MDVAESAFNVQVLRIKLENSHGRVPDGQLHIVPISIPGIQLA
jgi:hypothetical protein